VEQVVLLAEALVPVMAALMPSRIPGEEHKDTGGHSNKQNRQPK